MIWSQYRFDGRYLPRLVVFDYVLLEVVIWSQYRFDGRYLPRLVVFDYVLLEVVIWSQYRSGHMVERILLMAQGHIFIGKGFIYLWHRVISTLERILFMSQGHIFIGKGSPSPIQLNCLI